MEKKTPWKAGEDHGENGAIFYNQPLFYTLKNGGTLPRVPEFSLWEEIV